MAEQSVRSPKEEEIRRCRVSVPQSAKLFQAASVIESELILTDTRILCEVNGRQKEVLLEDLIGVQVQQKPPAINPIACQIEIHYYPLVRSGLSRKKTRKFAVVVVQFDSATTFRDNLYTAVEWKKAIRLQCNRALRKIFVYADEHKSSKGYLYLLFILLHHYYHIHRVQCLSWIKFQCQFHMDV